MERRRREAGGASRRGFGVSRRWMETRLHSRTWAKWSLGGGTGLREMAVALSLSLSSLSSTTVTDAGVAVAAAAVVVDDDNDGARGRGLG